MKRLLAILLFLALAIPAYAGPPGWRPGSNKDAEFKSVAIGTTATVAGQEVAVTVPAKYVFADNTARDANFDGDPETPTDGLWIVSDSVFQRYETDTWVAYQTVMQGPPGAAGADGADGAAGADGADAYVYIAYASDDSGTDFTTTFNSALDYIAVLSATTEIPSPAVGDFAGLWKKIKGEDGADGADGLPGAGVSWEGAYSAETTYAADDAVEYNGSAYIANASTTGETPGVAAAWDLWVAKGDTGDTGSAGADGADGTDGADAFVYIAYASDASGTGFTTTFNAELDYIAVLATDTEIPSPAVGDFAGLWKNYKGATGPAGADGADGTDGVSNVVAHTAKGSISSGTEDFDSGNTYSITVAGDHTWTLTGWPTSSYEGKITVYVTNGGSATVTMPAAVDWEGGTAPTLTTAGLDVLVFTSIDAGTTIYGFVAGQDIK